MPDTQATWFAQLMAPAPGEAGENDEGADASSHVADGCMVKRVDTERIVRALAPGTRISPAAIHALAAVADYAVRKALNVRTKKIASLNLTSVPAALRPETSAPRKPKSRSRTRA
jgi:hypothetical protein